MIPKDFKQWAEAISKLGALTSKPLLPEQGIIRIETKAKPEPIAIITATRSDIATVSYTVELESLDKAGIYYVQGAPIAQTTAMAAKRAEKIRVELSSQMLSYIAPGLGRLDTNLYGGQHAIPSIDGGYSPLGTIDLGDSLRYTKVDRQSGFPQMVLDEACRIVGVFRGTEYEIELRGALEEPIGIQMKPSLIKLLAKLEGELEIGILGGYLTIRGRKIELALPTFYRGDFDQVSQVVEWARECQGTRGLTVNTEDLKMAVEWQAYNDSLHIDIQERDKGQIQLKGQYSKESALIDTSSSEPESEARMAIRIPLKPLEHALTGIRGDVLISMRALTLVGGGTCPLLLLEHSPIRTAILGERV